MGPVRPSMVENEPSLFSPILTSTRDEKKSPRRRWLFAGESLDSPHAEGERVHPWYLVLWLTGVDYFSTLGYQPGIALLAAGAISPIATAVLVLVTLLCALPVYSEVAGRSYVGQGSIAMLENLLSGWTGRIFVLALLGFAATDFVITMTLSAADAAQHAIENPYLHVYLQGHSMTITLALLALLAAVFLKGFSEAIELASIVAIPYLLLNVVVLARCVFAIANHPEAFANWRAALHSKGDWTGLILASMLIFPRLALGLSGFETGVSVMPLIEGDPDDESKPKPEGRIRNTRKLLAAAAILMSVLLLISSFVTTLLIPQSAYREGGEASGRAIAYLAHQYMGNFFGSLYDFSTILILWFAGASAMAGLLHLIPRYLPRLGMAPSWVAYSRPLVLVLFVADVIVTLVFRANVEAQGGAYATGVLVLMLSAAVAATLSLFHQGRRGHAFYSAGVAAVFAYTLVTNVIERPDGIIIATAFIFFILTVGGISRYRRATELRVSEVTLCDAETARLWPEIVGKRVNLVPVRSSTPEARAAKALEIRKFYKAEGRFAFVSVHQIDNRSEFFAPLTIEVRAEMDNYIIQVSQASAIPNTIAFLSELIDPVAIFLTLTRKNQMAQALRYLLFGEGEIGMMVYSVLLKYWEWTPEEDVRPLIFLMSD